MLTEKRKEEIKINLVYAEYKMENGEVSHYHVYKQYVQDVTTLLAALDAATGLVEMEERADEIVERENERIRNKTIGRYA